MSNYCEQCRSTDLELVYQPERSTRGISVYLCTHCGLVQSLPRLDRAERAPAAVSSGADWGNVRYGKGFRTEIAIDTLHRHVDLSAPLNILDVGSNRGSFVKALLSAAPLANIVAIEPDERVGSSCSWLRQTELIVERIENVALESGRFDVVHSCHTIEHLAAPLKTLADHWRVLKDGGLLYIDAPNTAILGAVDIVEEWFIDKHLYHFSTRTLGRMIESAGFDIVQYPDEADVSNLLFVARKSSLQQAVGHDDSNEVERAEHLMAQYIATRARNLMALTAVSSELARLAPRGVAVWGAGRLFDSLVVHGHFDTKSLTLLIDRHLRAHVATRHGCQLSDPELLTSSGASVVVVMSRDFAAEISAQARALAPNAEIFLYSDLLARARTHLAA